MQKYEKINITKDEIVPVAQKMRADGVHLAMIHAFIDDDGTPDVSYEYDVNGGISSYTAGKACSPPFPASMIWVRSGRRERSWNLWISHLRDVIRPRDCSCRTACWTDRDRSL